MATAVSECFTEDAVVKDEGNTYTGREAIHEWKTESSEKYNYTVEPFALEEVEGKTVVTAHVIGNFPGSPVDLRYFFGLEGRQDRVIGDQAMSFDLELAAVAPLSRAAQKA